MSSAGAADAGGGGAAAALIEPPTLARQRSKIIDRQMRQLAKEMKKQMRLLLLGTGQSGKSTIVKQMKIIHGGGYTDREREAYRDIVHENIITAMQVLYDGLAVLNVSISSPELAQEAAEWFEALNPTVTTAPLELFGRLWADPGVQEVYSRRHLLQLSDGATHYMESLDRLADPKWVPSDRDVLYARLPTRGVHEYVFGTKWGQFLMIDVGGQKSERRKWFSLFDDVAAVIFVVASSDFDQTSTASESGGNRLRESLQLFSHMMRGEQLKDKSVVLFFNKSDLLAAKLAAGRSVKEHFPEYTGPEGDLAAVQAWLAALFRSHCPGELYHHYTTAVDTANISHVFNDVQDILMQRMLANHHLG